MKRRDILNWWKEEIYLKDQGKPFQSELYLSSHHNNKTQQRSYVLCRLVTLKYCAVKDLDPLRCPYVSCSCMPILHSPLQHSHKWRRRMLFECHLNPLPPQWPRVQPGQPSLFHIFPLLNKNVSPHLLHLYLISSLSLSNFPIAVFITMLLSFFLLPLFKTWEGKKEEKENAFPPVKKRRDEWLFRVWLLEKKGLLCLWNAEWERVCGFWTDAYERCTV